MATALIDLERDNRRRDLQTGRLETKIRLIEDRTNQFLDLLGNIQLQVGAGATVGGSYLTVNTEANLPYHRQIVWGDGINATDGGPGSTLTADVVLAANSGLQFAAGLLQLGTPTTLNTTSVNSVTTATHSHDITTTADGAANASTVLQSGTSGELALFRLFVDDRVMHDDDPDTYLEFTVDQANFTIGGLSMLTLTESTQDLITLGPGSGDVDIDFNGDMFLRGSDGFFGFGTVAPNRQVEIRNATEAILRLSEDGSIWSQISHLASDNSMRLQSSSGPILLGTGGTNNPIVIDADSNTVGLRIVGTAGISTEVADLYVQSGGNLVVEAIGGSVIVNDNLLHVSGGAGVSAVHVEEISGTIADRTLLTLENNGAPAINFIDNNASQSVSMTQFGAGINISSGLNTTLLLTSTGDTSSNRLPSISFVHSNATGARISGQRDSGDSDGMHLDFYTEPVGGALTHRMRITKSGNFGFNTSSQFGTGAGVLGILNAASIPSTNPTGGGVLYAEGGALKWRGSSGTVTTIANA